MKTTVIITLCLVVIVGAVCGILLRGGLARASGSPGGLMTQKEYSRMVDIRAEKEKADFLSQKALVDMNALITGMCQDRAIPVERCNINPNTRAIVSVPPPPAPPK